MKLMMTKLQQLVKYAGNLSFYVIANSTSLNNRTSFGANGILQN